MILKIIHALNLSSYEVRFERDGSTRCIVPGYASWRAANDLDAAAERARQKDIDTRWARTFEADAVDAKHFPGSHWDPFFEGGATDALKQLPDYLENSLVQIGHAASDRPAPYSSRHAGPGGAILAWPIRMRGVQMIVESAISKTLSDRCFHLLPKEPNTA